MIKYTREELVKILAEMPYTAQSRAVEQERCDADLLYQLLMHPEHVLTLADPNTGTKTQMLLIDRILGASLELICKKNSPDYEKSRMIKDARRFIQSSSADPTVKLFNFLFVLRKEPEIQALMLKGYVKNSPGNLWGANFDLHFEEFIKQLDRMTEATLNWPCNELNIVHVVRNFVQAARRYYLTT